MKVKWWLVQFSKGQLTFCWYLLTSAEPSPWQLSKLHIWRWQNMLMKTMWYDWQLQKKKAAKLTLSWDCYYLQSQKCTFMLTNSSVGVLIQFYSRLWSYNIGLHYIERSKNIRNTLQYNVNQYKNITLPVLQRQYLSLLYSIALQSTGVSIFLVTVWFVAFRPCSDQIRQCMKKWQPSHPFEWGQSV